jgi:hypothetical protein
MTRVHGLTALVVAVLSIVLVATAMRGADASASSGESVVVSLGDRIRLDQVPVGCRVARLAGHGSQAFVDCRRAGALRGTYGTYFGKSKVVVVRYIDSGTARVVFQARHERPADRCG